MIVDDFITAFEDPDYGKQNPFLVLSSAALELKKAGLAYDRLAPTWERMRDERRLRRGIFKRKPIHLIKYGEQDITTSHDEWLGLAALSMLFDNGETAREILDEGLIFGLWLTGKNEKGYWLDSEWFTPWRPEYRAFMKLAAGRKISWLENFAMRLNVQTNIFNMNRIKILFLDGLGYDRAFLTVAEIKLGTKFKGWYGRSILFKRLWDDA